MSLNIAYHQEIIFTYPALSVEPAWRSQIFGPWPSLFLQLLPPNTKSEDFHGECSTEYISVYENEIKVFLSEKNFIGPYILDFIASFQMIFPKMQEFFKG